MKEELGAVLICARIASSSLREFFLSLTSKILTRFQPIPGFEKTKILAIVVIPIVIKMETAKIR
jgi:hypothetical protein